MYECALQSDGTASDPPELLLSKAADRRRQQSRCPKRTQVLSSISALYRFERKRSISLQRLQPGRRTVVPKSRPRRLTRLFASLFSSLRQHPPLTLSTTISIQAWLPTEAG